MSLGGIAGSRQYAMEPAVIWFEEQDTNRYFAAYHSEIAVGLLTNDDINGPGIPSLLGRDIMNQGLITVHHANGDVILDIPGIYGDEVLPSPQT